MKRLIALVLSMAMALSLVACSSGSSSSTPQSTGSTPASSETSAAPTGVVPEYLEFFSGSQGGSWYQVGAQIATLVQESTGIPSKVAAGGGSANPDTLENGEGYFGLAYSGVGYQAYMGQAEYTEPHESLRAVISMYYLPFLIVALANDNSVNSVADLADKDISLGKSGQTGYILAQQVLKAYDIDIDDPASFTGLNSLLGDSERMDLLRDRQLDCITGLLPLDNATLQSMSQTPGIKLISLDEDAVEKILAAVPGAEKIVIPPYTFDDNQSEEILTVSVITTLFCREELDEELVYQVTKTIYENAETLYQFFGEEYSVILDNPLAGIDENMPLHPGAERFYREIGVLN